MAETVLERVTRALIRLLKAEVCPNVEVVASAIAESAAVPVVFIDPPAIQQVPDARANEWARTVDEQLGKALMRPPPKLYDLQYAITLVANTPIGEGGLLTLQTRLLQCLGKHPELVLDSGEAYRLEYEPNIVAGNIQPQGPLLEARAVLWVREVPIESELTYEVALVLSRAFQFERKESEQ